MIQLSLVIKHMLYTFPFIRYSRRTLNFLERITLSDLTHMMSMVDHMAISEEIPRIDNGCSLTEEFTELIRMNP